MCTFDEADMLFDPSKELNFPVGKPVMFDKEASQLLRELFIVLTSDSEIKEYGLKLCENQQSRFIFNDEEYLKIKEKITQKLLERLSQNSQWSLTLLHSLSDESEKEALLEYLISRDVPPTEKIIKLAQKKTLKSKQALELITLVRMELDSWLKSAWMKNADEHYAFSIENPRKNIAIPCLSANTPDEKSEMADRWEMANKTYQLFAHKGLTPTQTKELIIHLKDVSEKEWIENGYKGSKDDTCVGERFFKATGKQLSHISFHDTMMMHTLSDLLKSNTTECLELTLEYADRFALRKYEIYEDQINNTPSNLASAVNIVQGYTGTMETVGVFPKGVEVQKDFGTDGRTVDLLVRENTTIKTVEEGNAYALLEGMYAGDLSCPYNAIIDVGAYFKGQDNETVAKDILKYHERTPIKGVLFFDKENRLSFIKKGKEESPIVFTTTDPLTIAARTGLKKEELFTFYDQSRITGCDIHQAASARAITTIGEQTPLRNILQGVRRMRQLHLLQRCEFAISPEVRKIITQVTEREEPLNIETLLSFGKINSTRVIQSTNLQACLNKLKNEAQEVVRKLLYSSEITPEQENTIFEKSKALFIRNLTPSLFEHFGVAPQSISITDFLELTKQNLLAIVQDVLNLDIHKSPGMDIGKEQYNDDLMVELQETWNTIIQDHPDLPQNVSVTCQEEMQREATVEQAIQEEQEAEVDLEQKEEVNLEQKLTQVVRDFIWKDKAAKETPWTLEAIQSELVATDFNKEFADHPPIWRLSDYFLQESPSHPYKDLFDKEIQVTQNFCQTFNSEINLFDEVQKPIYDVLVQKKSGQWVFTILSIAEAAFFQKQLRESPKHLPATWLCDPAGNIIQSGSDPLEKDADFHRGVTQTSFLAGDIKGLSQKSKQEELLRWLKSGHPFEKRMFF